MFPGRKVDPKIRRKRKCSFENFEDFIKNQKRSLIVCNNRIGTSMANRKETSTKG